MGIDKSCVSCKQRKYLKISWENVQHQGGKITSDCTSCRPSICKKGLDSIMIDERTAFQYPQSLMCSLGGLRPWTTLRQGVTISRHTLHTLRGVSPGWVSCRPWYIPKTAPLFNLIAYYGLAFSAALYERALSSSHSSYFDV